SSRRRLARSVLILGPADRSLVPRLVADRKRYGLRRRAPVAADKNFMKHIEGAWRNRIWSAGMGLRRRHAGVEDTQVPASGTSAAIATTGDLTPSQLRSRMRSSALAFRGYDVANIGRSAELIHHPAYGPVVAEVLAEVSAIASEALHLPLDLKEYVLEAAPAGPERFPHDVAMIVGMELAQLKLLERFF